MKKSLKLFAVSIAAFMTAATMAGLASCGGDDALKSEAKVTLSYWNSISGSDSEYMQNLVRDFNEDYKGEIYVENDTLLEDAHYQRILTSLPTLLPQIFASYIRADWPRLNGRKDCAT